MDKEKMMKRLKNFIISNWKKLLLGLGVVLLSVIVIITQKTFFLPIAEEEYTVYYAVIESVYLTEGIELIVIMDHTVTGAYPSGSLDNNLEYVQGSLGPAIESETLNDYKAKNRRSRELGKRFSSDVQYVLLNEVEFNEIFETGGDWTQFYETYPNSQGIMTLSRVGFNAGMDQALVYMGNQSDFLAGTGYYALLTKKGGAWTIQSMVVAWIS